MTKAFSLNPKRDPVGMNFTALADQVRATAHREQTHSATGARLQTAVTAAAQSFFTASATSSRKGEKERS